MKTSFEPMESTSTGEMPPIERIWLHDMLNDCRSFRNGEYYAVNGEFLRYVAKKIGMDIPKNYRPLKRRSWWKIWE